MIMITIIDIHRCHNNGYSDNNNDDDNDNNGILSIVI